MNNSVSKVFVKQIFDIYSVRNKQSRNEKISPGKYTLVLVLRNEIQHTIYRCNDMRCGIWNFVASLLRNYWISRFLN